MASVRGDVNIRTPARIGEVRRHHVQGLHTLDVAVRIAQRPDVHRAVQLIHDVGVLLIRVEDHVTRASAFYSGHFRRRLRRQLAVVAKSKQADTILFQRRYPQGAVIRGDVG